MLGRDLINHPDLLIMIKIEYENIDWFDGYLIEVTDEIPEQVLATNEKGQYLKKVLHRPENYRLGKVYNLQNGKKLYVNGAYMSPVDLDLEYEVISRKELEDADLRLEV